MRAHRVLTTACMAVALAGCYDGPVSVSGGNARLLLSPQFSYSGTSAGLPIEFVRASPVLYPEGTPLGGGARISVTPTAPTFVLDVPVDLGGRDSAQVIVHVEMLSDASGSEIVEWSAVIGPVAVYAQTATPVQQTVELIRGPIENQLVDAIFAYGPGEMYAGQSLPAWAEVTTRGDSHLVLWSSTDESVVTVDPIGDSIDVRATGGGSALVIAAAGSHADTLHVFVSETTAGPIASVTAYPDSGVVVLGSSRTWQAYATDSNGIPVNATIAWTTLDPGIASVSNAGVVTGMAIGRGRIVASAGGFADTAIVHVDALPEGVDLLWQGGTPGAESDWFTADNWSPARVPGAQDVIFVPGGSAWLHLDANAEVGGVLTDTTSTSFFFELGPVTLTVHGDVVAPYGIYGEDSSRIVIDAPTALLGGTLPSTTILGQVTLVDDLYIQGDLVVDAELRPAAVDFANRFLYTTGDARFVGAGLSMTEDPTTGEEAILYVLGDLLIDGGDTRNTLTGGIIIGGAGFTVTATSCAAFAPSGTEVEMYGDSLRIDVGCAGLAGNSFHTLWVLGATAGHGLLELASDVVVRGDLYVYFDSAFVAGNGHTISAPGGDIQGVELNHAFLEIDASDPSVLFHAYVVSFSGMAGTQRPQLVYRHPGEACECLYQDIVFDPAASGAYVLAVDTDQTAPFLTLVMEQGHADGPERTSVSGGAQVFWRGEPFAIRTWSGNGQSGVGNQLLPEPLRAQVIDYLGYGIDGLAVDWAVTAGNGSVAPTVSTTDSAGIASTDYTVGDMTQATHQVTATTLALPGESAVFSAFPTSAPGAVSAPGVVSTSGAHGAPASLRAVRPARPDGAGVVRRLPSIPEFDMPTRPTRPGDGDGR